MQLTSLVLNHVEPGKDSTEPRFGSALRMCVENDGGGMTLGAFAVLIAPNIAVTTSHCVTQWQPNLHVYSALTGERATVERICWAGGAEFVLGRGVEDYPSINPAVADEGLVVLVLSTRMTTVQPAAPQVPPAPEYTVVVAAETSGKSNQVTVATLRVATSNRSQFQAVEADEHSGFPYASGAPAYLEAADAGNAIVGVQVAVAQAVQPKPAERRVASFVAITATRLTWLRKQVAAANPPMTQPPHGIAPPERRTPPDSELRDGQTVTTVPRSFVIRRSDDSLHSERDCLVEIDDVDFFHACSWNLIATGTLHLLTSDGTLWTRREPGTETVRAQILVNGGTHDGLAVDVPLAPAGIASDNRLWLYGAATFDGQLIHVYIYRTTDDPDPSQTYRKRVRVEAYVHDGVHMLDRPENHSIVFGGCSLIPAALGEVAAARPTPPLDTKGGKPWPVQDDVANGHEGHKPN